MKARIKWIDGMAFLAETGSGHAVVMDGSPDFGGRNIGVRPMELLLVGMGGCTAFDVVQILKKGRENVEDVVVEVSGERATEDPKVFTTIHLDYKVKGKGLSPAKVERAITLSKEKYCSASIMLGQVAKVTHTWSVEDGSGA